MNVSLPVISSIISVMTMNADVRAWLARVEKQ